VMERRLTHLPGNLRLLVIALVVLSVATMLTLAFHWPWDATTPVRISQSYGRSP
jgi:hypothetical protein